ncbi:ATP-binding protein [Pollutimonas sp. M17]|uniref:ATP-binding protein n=1 Tax=Pollutimonas sp. M17 TaxID=2962065 RepID=UPI0021F3CB84|nr:YhaN family protein [Pollutimonas sp. M17]UYO95213.1 AAA family ATPase [Pollutimonas sp. M17]
MRFSRFDLLRYGKFTDRRIEFPRAPRDFHLIVGANEAGKSTVRSAILDLLFGFPMRTALDFLHAKADMRLGAAIQGDNGDLEFIRLKANKNTLRDPEGNTLADTILDAWMGHVGRGFFDKMFGLDHPRLVEGGNSILNAQDDVGQILFQSAAGVASLGGVRDALEEEAGSLWAPVKSSKRTYYAARDGLDAASAALKAATVQTKEWAEANERVQSLAAGLERQREQQAARQGERSRLERIRRMAPIMLALREYEGRLAELEPVVQFPADAARMLAEVEQDRVLTQHGLGLHRAEAERLESLLEAICIDDATLNQADAVEALESLRHQYGGHAADMERSQGQAALLWREIRSAADELGWRTEPGREGAAGDGAVVEDEALRTLQARLPGLPTRTQLEQLLRDYGAITMALDNARAAESGRQAELRALEAKLEGASGHQISPALRAALEAAQARGDLDAALRKARAVADGSQAALDHAMARLGAQPPSLHVLRTAGFPSRQAVAAWISERQGLVQDLKSARLRCEELAGSVELRSLEAQQYRQRHSPTTWDEVAGARLRRDASWREIRSGRLTPNDGADRFEDELRAADQLADARHDKAREAAQLQNLQELLQQEKHKLEDAHARHAACRQAVEDFDARWSDTRDRLGLAGMPLDELPEWLARKDEVLEAARALDEAGREVQALCDELNDMCGALRQTLAALPDGAPATAGGDSLASLRAQAGAYVREADLAHARRDAWTAQAAESRPILLAARQTVEAAQARLDAWQRAWAAALAQAGLDGAMSTGAAQGALTLLGLLADRLGQLHRLRAECAALQADLDDFLAQATRLAQAAGLGQSAAGIDGAFELSQALAQRLSRARQARDKAAELKRALEAERVQIRQAEQSLAELQARLQPMMERAGVAETRLLEPAIARSDRHRALAEQLRAMQARLLAEGDGYDRERLQAEIDTADIPALPARLAALEAEIGQGAEQQNALAVELAEARRELEAMAGADAAARAEAQRQEALARMSDAAERYIKVYTASRLLRWSIDRYREEKQGPMLGRASAIFAQLTLNSFERLRVDFDKNPMVLEGQRPDGHLVGIAGMSDGTRDQLYLALRLAALELHLRQAPALPFIADDLFINYDDARAEAGLRALAGLSEHTQVIFLSHHHHLTALARRVFGDGLNVVSLD